MEYSFFDGLGVSCGVLPCGWWDSPAGVAMPVVGLSRGLKNIHRMFFAPVCGLVPTCSSPTQYKRGTAQWAMPLLVPVVGLEPTRCRHQRILSPSRLPIPSHRRVNRDIIADTEEKCKDYFFFLRESLHKIQKVGLPNGRKMWYNKQNYAQ